MIGSVGHGEIRDDRMIRICIRTTLVINKWLWKSISGLLWARGQVLRRTAKASS